MLLLTEAAPMLTRMGALAANAAMANENVAPTRRTSFFNVNERKLNQRTLVTRARRNAWDFLLPHNFFHRSNNLGRLVQHFLGQGFHLIAVDELRFETLFFGVGN